MQFNCDLEMKNKVSNFIIWKGKYFNVNILFSRAGLAQQILISQNQVNILIDTGDGSLRDIIKNGETNIDGIIYTHGHFDHIGGLYSILGFLRMIGRKQDLNIFIPEKCFEVKHIVECFKKTYSISIGFKINIIELKKYQEFKINNINIKSFPLRHCGSVISEDKKKIILDSLPSYGYRFSYNNEEIAITGDTGNCPELHKLVEGTDLAIIEATIEDTSSVEEEYIRNVHLSEEVAKDIGSLSKKYILVHKGKRNKK